MPEGDLTRFYEPVVDAIAASGARSSSTPRAGTNPAPKPIRRSGFLELACSAGIPLVISSDAHAPEEVGRDFANAIELAKAAGFRDTVLFEKRTRRTEAL